MANSELKEVFLSGGLHGQQQAASQEWPGSKEPSRGASWPQQSR